METRTRGPLSPVASTAIATVALAWLAFGPTSTAGDHPKADVEPPLGARPDEILTGPGAGEQSLGFPSSNVQLLAHLTNADLGVSSEALDCWGYVSPSGREYAVMCMEDATVFVDVTIPTAPQVIGNIPGPNGNWRDAKTYGAYCYSVCETNCQGVQVIDLTQIDSGIVSLVNTFNGAGSGKTHNVAINTSSGHLYRCGGSGNGLRIYDLVANPVDPPFVGSWSDGYVHDAQVITYESGPLAGTQMAVCGNGSAGTLTILDVTDKSNVTVMSFVDYGGEYSHQGWMSEDLQYYYHNDERDEVNLGIPSTTYIFDVADPNNASLLGTFTNGNSAVDHNLYTRGNYIFETNYTSGLRVYDATDPVSLVEVGFFDTYPANDDTIFEGARSCYPYLPSEIVLVCDRQSGLFVLWFGEPLIGENFCSPAAVNSTGLPARIHASGSAVVTDDDVTLTAFHVPPNEFGYFLASVTQGMFMPPGSSGIICLDGDIGRFNQPGQVGVGPTFSIQVDLTSIPVNPPAAVQPGDTWNFQAWYRDVGSTNNFTDAVSVLFQ